MSMQARSYKRFLRRRYTLRILIFSLVILFAGMCTREKAHQWRHCLWGWRGSLSLSPHVTLFTDAEFTSDDFVPIIPDNVSDMVLLASLMGDGQNNQDIAISPDSSLLAVANSVEYRTGSSLILRTCGTVWLWAIGSEPNPEIAFIPSELGGGGAVSLVNLVGFSPDGKLLFSEESRLLDLEADISSMLVEFLIGTRSWDWDDVNITTQYRAWETDELKEQDSNIIPESIEVITPLISERITQSGVEATRYDAEGRNDDRQVTLYHEQTGEQLMILEAKPQIEPDWRYFDDIVSAIAFSPDGKFLIIAIDVNSGYPIEYTTIQVWGIPAQ